MSRQVRVMASHAGVVSDELGDHFDQRRALLGEVRVGPRLVRVRVRVRARVRVRVRVRFCVGPRLLRVRVGVRVRIGLGLGLGSASGRAWLG